MTDLNVFGASIIDTEIGNAVESTLDTWFATYLSYLDRALIGAGINIGSLPTPGSYVHSADPNHFPEEQPPTVVISIPGTLGEPKRDSANYRAFWDLRVVVFVTAPDRASTEALAKYYGAAVRMMLVQKPSLGNFAEGISWRGTQYSTRIADRDQRTLGSCENRFSVDVRDVVQAFAGPITPITTIPANWPTVTDVAVSITPDTLS